VPVVAVVGDRDGDVDPGPNLEVIALAERYGLDRALSSPLDLLEDVVAERLSGYS
jgi:hypothetical protein